MRIVHLARDEKFLPLLQRLFDEALPGANHWVIARKRRAAQRFVADAPNVCFRPEWWFRLPFIARDVAAADVLVAHSMTSLFANAIRRAPGTSRAVWLGWGYDYYPLLTPQLGDPLLPATRALLGQSASGEEEPPVRSMALSRVAGRLHSFCVLPSEVALLRRALPALVGRFHELPLFTAEDTFASGPERMDGPDILLGNSATASNNHADALDLLAGRLAEGPARVLAPLSYGNADYGARVAALGEQRFGERFHALRQWMSLVDYNQRIAGCGFVVMNHRRQQAVGNIGAALYKGATVYLRPENPLYSFYRDLGLHLRAIDELAGFGPLEPITAQQRQHNREVIGRHYARQRVLQAIRTLPALQPGGG